jgi:hypothetical protein
MHFVRGWAKERGNTRRIVLDGVAYADMVRAHGDGLDPTDLEGFFPLYRRPWAAIGTPA